MIRGDRDLGGAGEETEKPCHWLFDLTIQDSARGGYSSGYNLEVESEALIPYGATNRRPVHEGSVVQETYDLSDPEHPKPIRRVHTHELGEGFVSPLGYRWTTTKTEPISGLRGIIFRLKNPRIF